MRLLLCLFALTLFACSHDVGHGNGLRAEIDTTFAAESLEIVRAGNTWNSILLHPILFGAPGDWLIVRAENPPGFDALTWSHYRLIRISLEVPHDRLFRVALHELGHAMGLEHTSRGVMCGIDMAIECPSPAGFSDEDIVECRRVGACR